MAVAGRVGLTWGEEMRDLGQPDEDRQSSRPASRETPIGEEVEEQQEQRGDERPEHQIRPQLPQRLSTKEEIADCARYEKERDGEPSPVLAPLRLADPPDDQIHQESEEHRRHEDTEQREGHRLPVLEPAPHPEQPDGQIDQRGKQRHRQPVSHPLQHHGTS